MTEWLQALDREYLRDFIAAGGGCVKFAIGQAPAAREAFDELESLALGHGFLFIELGAAETKLNRSDQIFFDIAKNIDWDGLARRYVASALGKHGLSIAGYEAAGADSPIDLGAISAAGGFDEPAVRAFLKDALLHLYQDYAMCQEFRLAMVQLCRAQIAGLENFAEAVKTWLRGELRRVSEVKGAKLFQKIGRNNGRTMLQSLTVWLRRNGVPGLVLAVDIGRCTENVRKADRGAGWYYSSGALTEAYEVLRQLIDSSSCLQGTLIAVFAPPEFLSDETRGVDRYQALKMRIFDDVRSRGRQNILAPLVRLDHESAPLEVE
jgi:P-loop Domain of unknown function (DUF2791)